MRVLILTQTILLSFSIGAFAETLDEKCEAVGFLAYTIMIGRQGSLGLTKMIEEFSAIEGAREIILDAHEWPHYSVNENKRQAWKDFRDEWALKCYKSG